MRKTARSLLRLRRQRNRISISKMGQLRTGCPILGIRK